MKMYRIKKIKTEKNNNAPSSIMKK